MNKSMIAALLSAFVCPGAGHFYLKQPKIGTLLSCTSLSGLVYLLYQAVQQAQLIADRILSGELPLDVNLIYQQITQVSADANLFWINVATYSFIISWLVGMIDSYRLGKKLPLTQE